MIRFLLRSIGLLLLALGFIFLVYDGIRSISDGTILLTRTSNENFARLVPFLISFATVLFFAQGAFRRLAK